MESKSLEQLENDYWKEPSEFPTALVERCFMCRKIKLCELPIEQIRLLISQKIGLEHLIELALEKRERNILAEGNCYEGDLLDAISKIPTEFWSEKSTEFRNFKKIVQSNTELIKMEISEKEFDRISERIKASAQQ